MNINELDSFKLGDAINFHNDLNPQIWGDDHKMRPEVKSALMKIAEDFAAFLGIKNLALVDIRVSGSNAAYSYTPYSDIDLHLVVDFDEISNDDVYKELFDAKKYQYNDQRNIKIRNYDVELYVQDSRQKHVTLGEYSLLKDDWVRIPTKKRANLDDIATKLKYEKLRELIVQALASDSEDYVNSVLDIVKRYRKAGLAEKGEFGPENLAYKILRKQGYIQKLFNKRAQTQDKELSLEDIEENKVNELRNQLMQELQNHK